SKGPGTFLRMRRPVFQGIRSGVLPAAWHWKSCRPRLRAAILLRSIEMGDSLAAEPDEPPIRAATSARPRGRPSNATDTSKLRFEVTSSCPVGCDVSMLQLQAGVPE